MDINASMLPSVIRLATIQRVVSTSAPIEDRTKLQITFTSTSISGDVSVGGLNVGGDVSSGSTFNGWLSDTPTDLFVLLDGFGEIKYSYKIKYKSIFTLYLLIICF